MKVNRLSEESISELVCQSIHALWENVRFDVAVMCFVMKITLDFFKRYIVLTYL